MKEYLIGFDLGSSAIKASLIDAATGSVVASASFPTTEMAISSPLPDWAEQDPEAWWQNTVAATHYIMSKSGVKPESVLAVGISYQMHGLVIVDKSQKVLRPSIIWCDSRAVEIGNRASAKLGDAYCLKHLLNSPGNFTASKLKWVKDNEPRTFDKIHKAMLPGDFLAMRLTGEIATTVSGLSEGIFWDFESGSISKELLELYGISPELLADRVPTFSVQGKLTEQAAAELGLAKGTPVSYRAGDQPNNAFSLKALQPGEVAATAGTSGVIYSVVDKPVADAHSRVNTFVHVNHDKDKSRYGVLLCVNGTGIMNSWLRRNLALSGPLPEYAELNRLASQVPIGADGLSVLPFGNGAERMLKNRNIGASLHGLKLNRHTQAHLSRAVQEGIVFALGYGFDVLNEIGIVSNVIRAGTANMFLSDVFCEAFTNMTGCSVSLYNTDGAQGAARGAGVGIGYYGSPEEAHRNLACIREFEPDKSLTTQYREAYANWKNLLNHQLTI